MKRKRGKKGKSKKLPVVDAEEAVPNVVNLSTEDNSGQDDIDKDEVNSRMEAATPSSMGTDQPEKDASVNSSGLIDKPAGKLVYNRVKVKIRNSITLESLLTSSDAHTQSDTDKSSQHAGLEKQAVISDKIEDSANSLPEINLGVSVNQSKKAGSIKIKSSKGFSSSTLSPCNNVGLVQGERTQQKEPEVLCRDFQYNKQELNTALEVVKKIMKMEAAEPFNVPVNPVALGIPDYFDVIDTPMDFGTICSNLENGVKYMNSEDVFKDVQFIWGNCYKYNNKGDYVLELMKRVKKNFTKYWMAAGLYSDQPHSTSVESIHAKDVTPSSHGKMPVKGGHSKHKTRRRLGVKKHKDDCLCAICVMIRRRQEREENDRANDDQMEISDGILVQDVKPEATSQVESPCGEDTSSSMDNSLDQDADANLEDKGDEVKMDEPKELYRHLQGKQEEDKENEIPLQAKGEGEISEHSQFGSRSGEEHNKQYETQMVELGDDVQNDTNREDISIMQQEGETAAVENHKPKEFQDKSEKAKMYENLHRRFENPLFLELCGSLFSENPKSIWSGLHSLVQREGSARSSSIHAAIATFMN